MNTKEIRTLTNSIYDYAKQNSIPQAKEAYITLLEKAKDSPSIAKIIYEDTLQMSTKTLYSEAKKSAVDIGSTKPILEAVNKNSLILSIIDTIKKDKDVKTLRQQIDKITASIYKKTKAVRTKAKLTENNFISLNTVRDARQNNWLTKLQNKLGL